MKIDYEVLKYLPKARRLEYITNALRKDYTPSQKVKIANEIEFYIKKAARERQSHGGPHSGKLPERLKGDTRDIVAKRFGTSGRTLEKAKAVVQAAEENPEKYQTFVELMDRTGNVQAAFVQVSKGKKLDLKRKMAEEFQSANTEKIKLFPGDFRIMEIADNSVDLIFTDPPYLEEFIPIYRDLGIFANRKLKEGGSLITFAGHYALPQIMAMLCEHLNWHWPIPVIHDGPHRQMDGSRVYIHHKPLLSFIKGTARTTRDYIQDVIYSKMPEKILHKWEQSTVEAEYFINHLTMPGEVVCDPFMGSGTTGEMAVKCDRVFIGAEIDEDAFKLARMRILSAQNVSHEPA